MHNLRHFYYQNKEKIWKVVLIIAFLLGIIYFINYQIEKKDNKNNNVFGQNESSIYSDKENQTYISDKSAISGSTVTETEAKKINNTISKFLQYCKNGNVEEVYNMLSTDCKENEYNTLEKFQERYLNLKFNKGNTCEIEKWINNTYKITISEDILATGNANSNKQIEYVTIVEENSNEKLNVNGYIGQKKINKEETADAVKITVLSKRVYMDYEIYDYKVENLSDKTIKLDSLEKAGTMYLEASSESKYNAYAHELYDEDLEIKSKHVSNFNIKYSKSYSSEAEIEKIIFENLILDYPDYKNADNKKAFKDISQITINL